MVRSTEQQTQSGFLNKNITSYYLRSSVLGGRTVTEYDAAGARHISYTYAGGGVLTETTKTYNDAPWQQWRHTNPVTGDAVNTDTQGKQTGLTRLDPAGTNVGESDPFIDTGGSGESPVEAERVGLLPIGAGWGGSGSGSSGMRCNLDGVEIGCGWVIQMMDIGAARQCPNNDCGPRSVTVNITYESGRRETHRGLVNNPFFNVNETFTGLQGRLAAIGFSDMSRGFSWAVRNAVSYATLGSLADGGRNGTQGASFFAPPQETYPGVMGNIRFVASGGTAVEDNRQRITRQIHHMALSANCANAFAKAGLATPDDLIQKGIIIGPGSALNNSSNNNAFGITDPARQKYWRLAQGANALTVMGKHFADGRARIWFTSSAFNKGSDHFQEAVIHEFIHAAGAEGEDVWFGHDLKNFVRNGVSYQDILNACK